MKLALVLLLLLAVGLLAGLALFATTSRSARTTDPAIEPAPARMRASAPDGVAAADAGRRLAVGSASDAGLPVGRVELDRASAQVGGSDTLDVRVVRDEVGQPFPGAHVRLFGPPSPAPGKHVVRPLLVELRSDEEGRALVEGVAPAQFLVEVSAPGRNAPRVQHGGNRHLLGSPVEVRLMILRTHDVRLVRADGAPLGAADLGAGVDPVDLVLRIDAERNRWSGVDGAPLAPPHEVERRGDAAGAFAWRIRVHGGDAAWAHVLLGLDVVAALPLGMEDGTHDLVIPREALNAAHAPLHVRVVDARDGRVVPGAALRVDRARGASSVLHTDQHGLATLRERTYDARQVVFDDPVSGSVCVPLARPLPRVVEVEAHATRADRVARRWIHGSVRGRDGRPLAHTRVALHVVSRRGGHAEDAAHETRTTREGEFLFERVPAEEFAVSVAGSDAGVTGGHGASGASARIDARLADVHDVVLVVDRPTAEEDAGVSSAARTGLRR